MPAKGPKQPIIAIQSEGAPDITRHPQVGKEQVLETKTLFRNKHLEMDAFDKAYAESKKITEDLVWLPLYLKVGLFCGWTYTEFMDQPYNIIKGINKEIDDRLENLEDKGGFLNWMQISVALAITKCFGGSK